ncbi:hypothetical protein HFN60_30495 [Rhizobium leguminosarum]|uniref:hypothetical protein n=1 Tax=Rhizobium leguminosarum TaxID=384 RepID=UPI001C98C5DD|nr:hypothetical protein [Rhizobium leguminosarum]MBY5819923.1 hypothetical protein [Rhizobium leguminosarum]
MSTSSVITTVTTACGGSITAEELSARIADPSTALSGDLYALGFFSDVWLKQQLNFVHEMNVDLVSAILVAREFTKMAGWEMPLGKLDVDQIVKDRYRLKYLPVDAEYVDHYRDFLERTVQEQDAILGTLDGPEYELFQSFQVAQALYQAPDQRPDGSVTPEKIAANPDRYCREL